MVWAWYMGPTAGIAGVSLPSASRRSPAPLGATSYKGRATETKVSALPRPARAGPTHGQRTANDLSAPLGRSALGMAGHPMADISQEVFAGVAVGKPRSAAIGSASFWPALLAHAVRPSSALTDYGGLCTLVA